MRLIDVVETSVRHLLGEKDQISVVVDLEDIRRE